LQQAKNKIQEVTRERDQYQSQLAEEKKRNSDLAEVNRKQEGTICEQAEEIERLKRLLQQQQNETLDAKRETGSEPASFFFWWRWTEADSVFFVSAAIDVKFRTTLSEMKSLETRHRGEVRGLEPNSLTP